MIVRNSRQQSLNASIFDPPEEPPTSAPFSATDRTPLAPVAFKPQVSADTARPARPGAQYFNAATKSLVVVPSGPSAPAAGSINSVGSTYTGQLDEAGHPMLRSPKGNLYSEIGDAKVAEMKKDPHLSVIMEGYEEAVARTSTTFATASQGLSIKVREIAQSARGANKNGPSPEGARAKAAMNQVVSTWDPVAGTYQGFDPLRTQETVNAFNRVNLLTSEAVRSYRAQVGLDDDGNLRPGFDHLKIAPPRRKTREEAFFDHFPLATMDDFVARLNHPNAAELRWDKMGRGDDNPFSVNYIASKYWGVTPAYTDDIPLERQIAGSLSELLKYRRA